MSTATDKADAEMFRFLCSKAKLTDYDGGWRGVWDIRGIEGHNGDSSHGSTPYNHGNFRNAIKAAMKKEGK